MPISNTYRAVGVMLLGYILRATGHELPDEELADFMATLIVIAGAVWTLYERWKKGDITWHGAKKK